MFVFFKRQHLIFFGEGTLGHRGVSVSNSNTRRHTLWERVLEIVDLSWLFASSTQF